MKTKLDKFTETHLQKWVTKRFGESAAEHLKLIDSFLCDMDANELQHWIKQGWKEVHTMAGEIEQEIKGSVHTPNWWKQWGNGKLV